MSENRPLLAIPALITALANARQDPSVLFLGSRLDLTPDQEAALRRILEARKPRLAALASRLRDSHRRMVDDCVCLQSSPGTLLAAKGYVQELTDRLMREVDEASREIETLLDPAQLARTAQYREDASARLEGIRTYLSALWPQAQTSPVHGWAMAGTFPPSTQGAGQ